MKSDKQLSKRRLKVAPPLKCSRSTREAIQLLNTCINFDSSQTPMRTNIQDLRQALLFYYGSAPVYVLEK